MSFNRENVIWQSQDGTWNRGFFAADVYGDDPEWDVDYDMGRFTWVRTGLRTEQAAEDAWTGANPGGWTTVAYKGHARECKKYDAMAKAAKAQAAKRDAELGSYPSVAFRRGW